MFAGCLLIVTTCFLASAEGENGSGRCREKIKCVGETILSFDKGFSQRASLSHGRGRRPNITFHPSYHSDRPALSAKPKRIFFFPSRGRPVPLMASKNHPWWMKAEKPEEGRSKWRSSVRLCGIRSRVPEDEEEEKKNHRGG